MKHRNRLYPFMLWLSTILFTAAILVPALLGTSPIVLFPAAIMVSVAVAYAVINHEHRVTAWIMALPAMGGAALLAVSPLPWSLLCWPMAAAAGYLFGRWLVPALVRT